MSVKTGPRMALTALLVATGCSGGGSSSPPPEQQPALPPGVPFTLSGTVTYDFVPATYDPATGDGTLAFANGSQKPVRNARLQVRQGSAGTVLQETTTSATGTYSITFTPGASGALLVVVLAETVTPAIRVEDNTDGNAVWAVGKPIEDTSPTLAVRATHGWNGTAYVAANRIAAPFAILDSMYTAARSFLDIPRSVPFPSLRVNWSPDNRPEGGNKALGQITTSHYSPSEGEIYILGQAGVDTDEFDSHVIVHEWGHYFEDNLSRSDSPGGPHGPGDVLDPRLAFGEGYGNAIAAMLLPESVYADTLWHGPSIVAFGFDAEKVPAPTDDFADGSSLNPGPFSEMSILRVLYDLYDTSVVPEAHDNVALGLGPIYDTLVGPQKSTDSLTTIASFIAGLKAQPGVAGTSDVARIDAVLAERSIGPITDQWGAGDGDLAAMFPSAAPLPFSGGVTLDGGYDPNKWQAKQYWVVTGTGAQITATATSTSDVALEAYQNGIRVAFANSFPENQKETVRFGSVNGAKYVVVLTGLEPAASSYTVSVSVTSQ